MNICTSKIHKGNTEHVYAQTCVCIYIAYIYRLPGGSVVKNLPQMQETQEMKFRSLG